VIVSWTAAHHQLEVDPSGTRFRELDPKRIIVRKPSRRTVIVDAWFQPGDHVTPSASVTLVRGSRCLIDNRIPRRNRRGGVIEDGTGNVRVC